MVTLATMGRVAVLVARMWAADHATVAGCNTTYSCQVYSDTLIAGACNEDDRDCLSSEVVTGDDPDAPIIFWFVTGPTGDVLRMVKQVPEGGI